MAGFRRFAGAAIASAKMAEYLGWVDTIACQGNNFFMLPKAKPS
jgi:hypothetical protein